jgi:hypothetical protein
MLPIGYYAKLHSQERGYLLCHKSQTGLVTFLQDICGNDWTHEEKDAQIFPDYASANNLAYRKWFSYKVGKYEVIPCGIGLHPCYIQYDNKLYFQGIQQLSALQDNEKAVHWSSNWREAKLLQGPEEAAATLVELLQNN